MRVNLNALLQDLVSLRLPVTATAMATTVIGLVAPFGFDLSAQTLRITAALSVVGLIASYVQKFR